MPTYEYIALDVHGKKTRGNIDADSLRVARQKLRSRGIFPTEIHEAMEKTRQKSRDVKQYFQSNRVSTRELAIATRQLATLISAGLPLVSALQALGEQTDSITLKRIIVAVRENVEEGTSLAKALGQYPRSFPRLYVSMVAAGEASGTLDTVMENLADYLESQLDLNRKVLSALLYPSLMMVFCTLVVLGLVIFVVPNIVSIFEKQGATLPLPTQIMIGISHFFLSYGWLLILLAIGAAYAFRWYIKTPKGKREFDRLLLRAPLYRTLYLKVATARVSRTLGSLLESGVDLLAGLDITRNIVGNVHVAEVLERARDGVREGRSLSREIVRGGVFPSMIGRMVAVGEKSGQLEQMLKKAGDAYSRDVTAALAGLTSLLQPLIIIVVGVVVFFIIIAVLLPMVDLINLIQM